SVPARGVSRAPAEWLVGGPGLGSGGPDDRAAPAAGGGRGVLLDKPGFTRPGLAANEDQLTCAGADGGPALLGCCRLGGAADKDRLRPSGRPGRKRRSIPHPHLPTLTPACGTVDSQNWLGAHEDSVPGLVMTRPGCGS